MYSTVSIKLVQGILNAAASCNLNAEEILTATQLDPEIFQDADGRIYHEKYCELWQEISLRATEPAIGLRMAEFAKPATLDVLGYAIYSSANLGEALERVIRYGRLIHSASERTFEIQGKVARITVAVPSIHIPLHRATCEWIVANIVLTARRTTGVDLVPLKVGFQHSQPEDISAYRRLFRSPIEFNQPVNGVVFDAALLKLPLLKADPALCAVLDRYTEELLAKLPDSESFVDSIRRAIACGMRSHDPSLEAIAKRLGYTPRTLQRKLKEAGTSHQELLDQMRRELSIHYLKQQQIAVSEVAFLLGFSETSAFHRAFKRWTGVSPGEFRRTTFDVQLDEPSHLAFFANRRLVNG
jgi:AraC-like DNA-binding protein